MFEDEFILAAGLDYRNLDSFSRQPSCPLEQSFEPLNPQPEHLTDAASIIDRLKKRIFQQDAQISSKATAILELQSQVQERTEYIRVLENQIVYWKKRVFNLENENSQLQQQKMPSVIEEGREREDLGDSRDSIYKQIDEAFDNLKKTRINFHQEGYKMSDAKLGKNSLNPQLRESKENRTAANIAGAYKSSSHRKFKTLVKLAVQNMSLTLMVLIKHQSKALQGSSNALKISLSSFIQNFNKKYEDLRTQGFTPNDEIEIIRVLKAYDSQILCLYEKIFKKGPYEKPKQPRCIYKEELATTAKR